MNENTTPNQPKAPRKRKHVQFGPPPATDPSTASQAVVVIAGAKPTKRQMPASGPRLVGDEPVQ